MNRVVFEVICKEENAKIEEQIKKTVESNATVHEAWKDTVKKFGAKDDFVVKQYHNGSGIIGLQFEVAPAGWNKKGYCSDAPYYMPDYKTNRKDYTYMKKLPMKKYTNVNYMQEYRDMAFGESGRKAYFTSYENIGAKHFILLPETSTKIDDARKDKRLKELKKSEYYAIKEEAEKKE